MNSNRFGCTKDCKDRHPGCHGSCEKYQSAKQRYLDQQSEIARKRHHQAELYGAKKEAIKRCAAGKRR